MPPQPTQMFRPSAVPVTRGSQKQMQLKSRRNRIMYKKRQKPLPKKGHKNSIYYNFFPKLT
jgi:hypothetical protein